MSSASRWRSLHFRLADEVICDRERDPEIFTAGGCTILRKWRGGFEDQVSLGDQALEGLKRIAVVWHDSMVNHTMPEGNRSLFSVNAQFIQYPTSEPGKGSNDRLNMRSCRTRIIMARSADEC